jgi:hypothetical protein
MTSHDRPPPEARHIRPQPQPIYHGHLSPHPQDLPAPADHHNLDTLNPHTHQTLLPHRSRPTKEGRQP